MLWEPPIKEMALLKRGSPKAQELIFLVKIYLFCFEKERESMEGRGKGKESVKQTPSRVQSPTWSSVAES